MHSRCCFSGKEHMEDFKGESIMRIAILTKISLLSLTVNLVLGCLAFRATMGSKQGYVFSTGSRREG